MKLKRHPLYYVTSFIMFLMYWGYFTMLINWWAGALISGGLMGLQYLMLRALHGVKIEGEDEEG